MSAAGTHRGGVAVRLAAALVFALLLVGSFALWIAVPAGTVWALSQVIDSTQAHFGAAIVCVPLAMVSFAALLAALDDLYLRLVASGSSQTAHWRADGGRGRARGPLEPLLLTSLAVAVVGMAIWFFVFAENPLLW